MQRPSVFFKPSPKDHGARTCVLNAGAARCVERALPTWAEAPQPIANTQGALSGRERVGSCTAGHWRQAVARRKHFDLRSNLKLKRMRCDN